MKNIYSIIFNLIILISSTSGQINKEYITENFSSLSKKGNLISSFNQIYSKGDISLLDFFISLLNSHKINYISELESFYQKKHKILEKTFNKLKYKDEINIKKISPAFEWAETERFVIFNIKHSTLLNSLSCPFVDDEKFVIRKNKQDIHYEAKCILDNNYLFFNLDLRLYSFVTEIQSKEVQRGETQYVINKKNNEEWDGRLIEAGNKLPENSLKMF